MARIALFQMKNDGSITDNLRKSLAAIGTAAENGADLILFPEVQLTEFFPQYPGRDVSSYAVNIDSDIVRLFSEACKELHIALLADTDTPTANAVRSFFETWDPVQAQNHPALQENWDDLISGANLVFRHREQFAQEDPAIASAWERHYLSAGDGPEMVCLVTGQKGPVEKVHPAIKGVQGAQSSGAALVSFNAEAFSSYGKEQNYNAPTSQYAAFAYTAALNHLIADRKHTAHIGDTTVVCWAQGAEPAYVDFWDTVWNGAESSYSAEEIQQKVHRLTQGSPVEFDEARLDPNQPFYILGISPNAARLSVRFFLQNSFGAFVENVNRHYQRLEIVRPAFDKFETLPLWKLLSETVNQNSRDKSPAPGLAGDTMRAVWMDGHYPATLLNGVNLRIQAEHRITRGRAAIIKAYYLKNSHPDVPEEVLQVSLNPESKSIPYQLGRLFSVLESIQSAANPGINSTILDKYFSSASATPATVFPVLINLAQKHLKKIGGGLAVNLNKDLTAILGKLDDGFPARLSLAEQGAFQLGYYHQTQARYQGKSKEEE